MNLHPRLTHFADLLTVVRRAILSLRSTPILATTALILATPAAFGQPSGSISVVVINSDVQDLFLIIADQNQGGAIIFPRQRINQGAATNPLAATADGNGNGSITWRIDPASGAPSPRCGAAGGLQEGAQVNVNSINSSPC
jgi:hypothetical protein